MTKTHRPLGAALPVAIALVAATLALPLQAQTEPSDGPAARGLIVRLKQPVANDRLHPRGDSPRTREAMQESVRWQRVLGEAGLSGASGRAAPRLRPVGRDQQLIEFERPLSRSEAASLREKLMARPDVEWVEPNLRERRLQVPPSDPLFTQQWWLQPIAWLEQWRDCRIPDGVAARQSDASGRRGARHRHHHPRGLEHQPHLARPRLRERRGLCQRRGRLGHGSERPG